MDRKLLFIVSGPSGVGKDTLVNSIIENDFLNLEKIITYTTRPPRPTEKNGVNYHFISTEEFEKKIANREFVEWTIYSMHHYGTNINSFKVDKTKNYVAIIDVDGANELINRLNNKFKIITIFLMPPNYAILHDRLVNRGVNDENEINRRKKIAETEIKKSHFYKYKILMDDINNEINIICKIILNEIKENTK